MAAKKKTAKTKRPPLRRVYVVLMRSERHPRWSVCTVHLSAADARRSMEYDKDPVNQDDDEGGWFEVRLEVANVSRVVEQWWCETVDDDYAAPLPKPVRQR